MILLYGVYSGVGRLNGQLWPLCFDEALPYVSLPERSGASSAVYVLRDRL